jgi:ABC-type uncharacterized transport system substrate-binding protein
LGIDSVRPLVIDYHSFTYCEEIMRRRHFIAGIVGSVTFNLAAVAQHFELVRRIAVLIALPKLDREAWIAAFTDELQQQGWREGHDVEIEGIAATKEPTSIIQFAGQMLTLQPDIVLAQSKLSILALLPVAYYKSFTVLSGGLVSYGADCAGEHRCAARYVNWILKGAQPAKVLVERPDKFEVAVNSKTALALGSARHLALEATPTGWSRISPA